jgi:hypothetical protein
LVLFEVALDILIKIFQNVLQPDKLNYPLTFLG